MAASGQWCPSRPRTVAALDLYLDGRNEGRLLIDRHDANRIVARLARAAGLDKRITPHSPAPYVRDAFHQWT